MSERNQNKPNYIEKKSNVKTESTLEKQQIPKMISTCRFNNFFCLVHVKKCTDIFTENIYFYRIDSK